MESQEADHVVKSKLDWKERASDERVAEEMEEGNAGEMMTRIVP